MNLLTTFVEMFLARGRFENVGGLPQTSTQIFRFFISLFSPLESPGSQDSKTLIFLCDFFYRVMSKNVILKNVETEPAGYYFKPRRINTKLGTLYNLGNPSTYVWWPKDVFGRGTCQPPAITSMPFLNITKIVGYRPKSAETQQNGLNLRKWSLRPYRTFDLYKKRHR